MVWHGIKGDWDCGCSWRGSADGKGRPYGHGILEWPASSVYEFEEGAMKSGRRQTKSADALTPPRSPPS